MSRNVYREPPSFVVEQDASCWWVVKNRHSGAVVDSALRREIALMKADELNRI